MAQETITDLSLVFTPDFELILGKQLHARLQIDKEIRHLDR
ncbi:hypothetical protein FHS81_000750 [Pseudochelatococcus contaminans]|uniref:Uncharacterized protein n=1 Tax=Pseudochelatococcus contaminans TaxID=1538103 RepID=A0A7W5Z2Z1_9HYPH|nr:hypothetical protein [Pseudochelatococcus contaminans]